LAAGICAERLTAWSADLAHAVRRLWIANILTDPASEPGQSESDYKLVCLLTAEREHRTETAAAAAGAFIGAATAHPGL